MSWYATKENGPFTLNTPWWISGERCSDGAATVCAAVMAESAADAQSTIVKAHDSILEGIEWRFVNDKPEDWDPFCDRFPRAKWMTWPKSKKRGGAS